MPWVRNWAGWAKKLAFGCGALFSVDCGGPGSPRRLPGRGLGAVHLGGPGGMGALVLLGCGTSSRRGPFPGLFTLRLAIALGVVFLFGAQPVQDFKTMYDAACQLARGSREYLQTDYFYNWAYQTGFVAYEALVARLFGEGLLPLQVLNAVRMAGTGCLVYGIARRFLPETGAMAASLLVRAVPGALLPVRRADQPAHRRVFLLPGLLAAGPAGEALPRRGGAGGAVPGGGQRHAPPGGGDESWRWCAGPWCACCAGRAPAC